MRKRDILSYFAMILFVGVVARAQNNDSQSPPQIQQAPRAVQAQEAPQVPSTQVPPLPTSPALERLTLAEAEQIALKNNPRMTISRLLALAQAQVTREVRSAELPQVVGNLTAVEPRTGTRITAGYINNPSIYQRAAGGVNLAQLITDFGHTRNLIASAQFQQRAQQENQIATAARHCARRRPGFLQSAQFTGSGRCREADRSRPADHGRPGSCAHQCETEIRT